MKPKHNDIFDFQNFYFDDDGLPHLKSHTCGNCGHVVHRPEDEHLFLDDDDMPVGLVVQTDCPNCRHKIFSACGSPEFVTFVQVAISTSSYPFTATRARMSTESFQ